MKSEKELYILYIQQTLSNLQEKDNSVEKYTRLLLLLLCFPLLCVTFLFNYII